MPHLANVAEGQDSPVRLRRWEKSSQKVPSDTVESGGYPFGPGSHTAEALDAFRRDDEGESLMGGQRKMYFSTLDDSMKEQGLTDVDPGPSVAASAPSGVPSGASARSRRRARRRAKASPETPGGCVVLIREDCRLHDNPALHTAAEMHEWVVPLYVHDDADPSPWPVRGAGLWWRHESLKFFDKSLQSIGSRIVYRKGNLVEQVMDVILSSGAKALHFNLQLEPWHHDRDLALESAVVSVGLDVQKFTAMVMKFEPWEAKGQGPTKCLKCEPLPPLRRLVSPKDWPWSMELAELGYGRTGGRKIPPGFRQFNEKRQAMLNANLADPKEDDWAHEMKSFWPMGEHAAMRRLEEWLKDAAWGCYFPPGLHPKDEVGGRFRADKAWTAMLSPYLRFGDLSPRYVDWRVCQVLPQEMRHLFLKRVV